MHFRNFWVNFEKSVKDWIFSGQLKEFMCKHIQILIVCHVMYKTASYNFELLAVLPVACCFFLLISTLLDMYMRKVANPFKKGQLAQLFAIEKTSGHAVVWFLLYDTSCCLRFVFILKVLCCKMYVCTRAKTI